MAVDDVDAAIAAIQVHALAIEEVIAAPEVAAPSINQLPFAVSYPFRTQGFVNDASSYKQLHTIRTEFHLGKFLMPENITKANAIQKAFMGKMRGDVTLGGAVNTIIFDEDGGGIPGFFGGLVWGGQQDQHIGWQFEITVKQFGATT